jgi:hypothetical protein
MAKRKTTGIRKMVKFYYWCVSKGIDLKYFDPMRIDFEPTKRVFSFYKNKQATKEKHNYLFPDYVYNKQIREILKNN